MFGFILAAMKLSHSGAGAIPSKAHGNGGVQFENTSCLPIISDLVSFYGRSGHLFSNLTRRGELERTQRWQLNYSRFAPLVCTATELTFQGNSRRTHLFLLSQYTNAPFTVMFLLSCNSSTKKVPTIARLINTNISFVSTRTRHTSKSLRKADLDIIAVMVAKHAVRLGHPSSSTGDKLRQVKYLNKLRAGRQFDDIAASLLNITPPRMQRHDTGHDIAHKFPPYSIGKSNHTTTTFDLLDRRHPPYSWRFRSFP